MINKIGNNKKLYLVVLKNANSKNRQQILSSKIVISCDDHHRYTFGKRSKRKGMTRTPLLVGVLSKY